jgi:four helix bundle protein
MQNDECRIKQEEEMPMPERNPHDLKRRTLTFAAEVIRLCGKLPRRFDAETVGKQVLRSATSVGAHYREAGRARSPAEFVSKMEVGLQEVDETAYWLELLVEADLVPAENLAALRKETDELTAIFVASIRTAKARRDQG